MAVVNKVQKSGHMNLWDIVKFQINLHCHLNAVNISDSDLECLTLLAINGETELTSFCNAACNEDERDKDFVLKKEREIFKTPQSVRNSVTKLERMSLISKKGRSKKKVSVDPKMQVQVSGNIFIEVKYLRKNESKET
tara:strand:- start:32911 stop:33324 length:414 start_codon:yes stop_codon:yes gene_type:complete